MTARLHEGSMVIDYDDIVNYYGNYLTIFTLPKNSALINLNANLDVAFTQNFNFTINAPEVSNIVAAFGSQVVGLAVKEFAVNPFSVVSKSSMILLAVPTMTGTWAVGGNLNTARSSLAGAGTQNAGLCMGGWTGANSAVTEEYNGTSWAIGGALNTARRSLAGAGTQTAGLCTGGDDGALSAVTEEYNGTSWATGGDLNTARQGLTGCGTQTAGLCMGGDEFAGNSAVTEEYNGTLWAVGGNLNTARLSLAGCGMQAMGLCMGGNDGALSTVTEEYTKNTAGQLTVRYAYITMSL